MVLWQRMLVTLVAMFAISFLAGVIWSAVFNVGIPSYLSGIIGGLTALPVWEFLKRIGSKKKK